MKVEKSVTVTISCALHLQEKIHDVSNDAHFRRGKVFEIYLWPRCPDDNGKFPARRNRENDGSSIAEIDTIFGGT
jgi:hypothetical protein